MLKIICEALERLCDLTHPFAELEIKLTGKHCNLALLSYNLDRKYNLNVWKKPEEGS